MNSSTDFKVIAGLLGLTLAIGGAGTSFPRLEMLLELCALAVAAYLVVAHRTWRFERLSSLALAVLALVLLLPALQLVPLPPEIWQRLPGRGLPSELDSILGARWRPLSLDVEATLRSVLSLLPSAVIFVGCLFLSRAERARLLWVVIGFALVSAVLGIAQLSSGGWLTPYPSGHSGYPVGFFVNRNHHAALLLAAMPVAGALGAMRIARGQSRSLWLVATLSTLIIFTITVLGTTSRMALVLLPVSLAAALLLLFHRQSLLRIALPSLLALAALASFLFTRGAFDRTLARFSSRADPRFDYWTDVQWALQHYGLAGTGFGTFVPVYQSAESLEAVVPAITNHAHNDYLEILLEGGVPAILILLFFLAILGSAIFRPPSSRHRVETSLTIGAGATAIAILLLFSVVDYPLRMPALSAVLALLCAALLPTSASAQGSVQGRSAAGRGTRTPAAASGFIARGVALAVAALLLIPVFQAGMSAYHILNRRYDAALQWAPWSTRAHERVSTEALLNNHLGRALPHALAAIWLSPVNAPAIRTIGLIRLVQGLENDGNRLMQIAVTLGWRDPLTQLWAIQAAETSQEPEKALQRAEALFRQNTFVAPAMTQLLRSPAQQQMISLLASRLEQRPEWRKSFLKAGGQLSSADAGAFAQVIMLLQRSEAPVSLDEADPLLDRLLARGKAHEAQRIWGLLHQQSLVSNGDFETVDERRGPTFPAYWAVPQRNRSRVSVEEPDFGRRSRALHISGADGRVILSQTLMLTPGQYQLTYRAHPGAGPGARFRWELRCMDAGPSQVADASLRSRVAWQQMSDVFIVPDQDCPIQRLALRPASGSRVAEIWFDEIRLKHTDR